MILSFAGWLLVTFLAPIALPTLDLQPGESYRYGLQPGASLNLNASLHTGAWRFVVVQAGVDVVVRIFDDEGQLLVEVDSPLDEYGEEWLLLEVDQPGSFTLAMTTRQKVGPLGQISVRLEPIMAKGDLSKRWLAAERADTAAGRFYAKKESRAWQPAIEQYLAAMRLWRDLGEQQREARSTYCAAVLYRLTNQPKLALGLALRARHLFGEVGDRMLEAYALNEMGILHLRQNSLTQARAVLEEAQTLWRSLGHSLGEGIAQSNLCLVLRGEGRERDCLPCFEKTRKMMQKARNPQLEATILISLGRLYDLFAKPSEAIASYEQAVNFFLEVDDTQSLARTRNNLGAFYRRMGRYRKALNEYHQALKYFEKLGDARWQGRVLNNLGNLYLTLESADQAQAYLASSLTLRRQVGDRRGELSTLLNLAAAADQLAEEEKARGFLQDALLLSEKLKRPRSEAKVWVRSAWHDYRGRRFAKALASINRALDLLKELPFEQDLARARLKKAHILIGLLRFDQALQELKSLKSFFVNSGNRAELAKVEYLMGCSQQQLGNPDVALLHAKAAIEHIEQVRTDLELHQLKEAFFGAQRQAYELLIDLYMTQAELHGREEMVNQALAVSEQSKARSFRELLRQAEVDLTQGVFPQLKEQRASLNLEVTALANRLQNLRLKAGKPEEVQAVSIELDSAMQRFQECETRIKRQSGHEGKLTSVGGLKAREIQALTDAETDLILFSLGEAASYMWWVRTDGISSYKLPSRSNLVSLVGRVLQEFRSLGSVGAGKKPTSLTELSELLLSPILTKPRRKRLVVIPDGILHYLPFDALEVPAHASEENEYLCDLFEVIHLPSASILPPLKSKKSNKTGGIAIFADPVFSKSDERLSEAVTMSSAAVGNRGGQKVPTLLRLHGTRRETRAILKVIPRENALVALDFEANREAFLSADLARYRWLHIATHGLVDTTRPELSCLVLSQYDREGHSRNGFLRLHDLYTLKVDAELAVLSGCDTALGRDIRGEGLVGLTRGFFYAGAHGVIASLWSVPDRATAQMMGALYQAMQEEGLSPPAALRAARLSIKNERRWRHPYFWAAFTYQGRWHPSSP